MRRRLPIRRAVAVIRITQPEFQVAARYVYQLTGIHLGQDKKYLLETRFAALLAEHRCVSFSEFLYRAQSDRSQRLARQVVDTITTNETHFFRDMTPFELLRDPLVPAAIKRRAGCAGRPRLRVWSAACATGQEVYSIAISLRELLGNLSTYDLQLVGTDISHHAVARAEAGTYSQFEVARGLPPELLERHFTREDDLWRVRDALRNLCAFQQRNLHQPFGDLGRFDVIFCRNVAIYFKLDDRKLLFDRLAEALEPDGALLIGASEFLSGVSDRYVARRHARGLYYQRAAAPAGLPNSPNAAGWLAPGQSNLLQPKV